MSLGLVLVGIVSLQDLPVREVPDIDPPVVTVSTIYQGANARVIETEVTERVEEAVNGIEGIKRLTSESREQLSLVTIEFELSRNIDLATQDVRDRVARIRGSLPDDIEEPVIAKQEAEASPILWVALFGENYSPLELNDVAENLLKDPLQTVSGVSSVILGGSKRFAIRIRLDSQRMAAHGVTVLDVEQALREQNVELPSGQVENLERELSIQTFGEMKTPEEFNELVILRRGSQLVRLSMIGRAEVGYEDEKSRARYNSKPAMGLGVVKQSKANTVAVANEVKRVVKRLEKTLPEGIETFIAYDESIFIDKAITEVWRTLAVAFFFVVITIFAFLRNARSTLVPALTIPVSIIGSFAILAAFGYSINILTMLALVLAIGLVVDDSIVVLENIYRHIEAGEPPKLAAQNAMKEISFAVIATTVALVAVFLPLAFQKSITGQLFTEFAITICGAVVISTFVALTLTPSIAARILKPAKATDEESLIARWAYSYRDRLAWCLEHRGLVIILTTVSVLCSAFFYMRLDKEFLPEEDKGRLFSLAIAPEGSTSEYTDRMVRQMEEIMGEQPEVAGFFSAVALPLQAVGQSNQGLMFVRFKEDRDRSLQDIIAGPQGIRARFFTEVEGAISLAILPKSVSRGFSQSFQLVLKNNNLDTLDDLSQQVTGKLQAAGFLTGVRPQFSFSKPELRVTIDRNRANALGVSILDISRTMQLLFGGRDISKIKKDGEQYDVIVQLDRESRLKASDLDKVYVKNDVGGLVQLSNVVRHKMAAGPNAVYHFDRSRSATIEGTPVPGVPLGVAIERTEQILAETLPEGASYQWAGEAGDLNDAGSDTLFVIILAIVVIYMVLAAQFESFIHPVTVMVSLPLAAFGAFGLLLLLAQINILGTGMYGWANYAPDPPTIAGILSSIVPRIPSMTINIYSQIGIVLLLGLVTKNSILLVEFANQLVDQGHRAKDAMLEAAVIRFRPILMTAIGTITGILPIAIGFGAGAEGRRPMGVAVIGGMISATIFTFFVIPVVYTLFDDWFHRRRAKESDRKLITSLLVFVALGLSQLSISVETALAQENIEASEAVEQGIDADVITLNLEKTLLVALLHNHSIETAKEEIAQQSNTIDEIRSFLLPRISLIGNYNETDDGLIESFGDQNFSSETNWNSRIELRQPIYSGGKSSSGFAQQKKIYEAAQMELTEIALDVLLQVRKKFYDLLLARSQLEVRLESLRLLEEELKSEKNRLKSGTVSQFNVLRAEVEVANARTPMIRAKNAITLEKQELLGLLGIKPAQLREGASKFEFVGTLEPAAFVGDLDELLLEGKKIRPKLSQLSYLSQAAVEGVGVELADYYPSIDLFGSWNYEKSRFSDEIDDTIDGWRAGVDFDWNIFSSFETKSRVATARNKVRKAEIKENQAKLDVEVEIKRAFFSVQESTQLLEASRKVVASAEESLRLARNRLSVGVGTQLEVLDSQVALTDARSNRVQALYDYNLANAQLVRAVGSDSKVKDLDNK
ncbi:UNVERIFIED_CONTAM: hypothetical protein GTU68_024536 [Idotea baltica]|nr:hypothetical protein [Idotea baltica]